LFDGITFAAPWFLLLLVFAPLVLYISMRNFKKSGSTLLMPGLQGSVVVKPDFKVRALKFIPFLRAMAVLLIVIGLAQPQTSFGVQSIDSEGIDIIMATDLSRSMELQDFKPNRIEAAKRIGTEFINMRPNDRIGLVVFAGESFTLCPLTIDHSIVINELSKVNPDFLQNGTAIGMGLATSVDRLRESNAKSRIVILLTDGVNNSGSIDPLTAAGLAVKYHVKIYSIGVGSTNGGELQLPGTESSISTDIDEALLQKISAMTGGRYFRAVDNEALRRIYKEIDQLEKVKIQSSAFEQKTDVFFPWLIAAFVFMGIEYLCCYVFIKTLS